MSSLVLRPETPADVDPITRLLEATFPTRAEASLVSDLRAAGNLSVSLVAVVDGAVVGHVAFSTVRAGESLGSGLAPLAVSEEWRHRGIASALVRAGLDACSILGSTWVVVLGHPGMYGRFGFSSASAFGLIDEYDGGDAFQVLEFTEGGAPWGAGTVRYGPEFARL